MVNLNPLGRSGKTVFPMATALRTPNASRTRSLVRARALRPPRQRSWRRDVVWFQLDEINGVFDGLQARASKDIEIRRQTARRRIERVVHAAAWCRDDYLRGAWELISDSSDDPEARFAPTVVLLSLEPSDPRVQALLGGLPNSVARTLADLGLTPPPASHRRRT